MPLCNNCCNFKDAKLLEEELLGLYAVSSTLFGEVSGQKFDYSQKIELGHTLGP